jgi:hypothetical protein
LVGDGRLCASGHPVVFRLKAPGPEENLPTGLAAPAVTGWGRFF